ncbi:D-2-hydroxyacid dehydrogenase family protein [Bifidobacterium sp. MA2]|uniref:D-2-hydroxyacid dehydrogenase family protein n=1 Tax=Bifidobacterium santillanense TaxID=2809028 RepID=A0ABS5URT9_9BIFI|nr:D-2-hydroxyacid dehydrogenase family protein [Bifidobacterium santillanense]MBT1173692.1 D-2-hydroxyacid dehydrogenase family protein [Bifidobacterium santillanense]
MTEIFETQPDRADLPLVVMPASFASMVAPLKAHLPALADVARVRLYEEFTEDPDLIAERVADADVMINGGPHISDDLLRRISGGVRGGEGGHVRCIVFSGTGVASYIDLALARELGVRVCNAEHYGDAAVAEHTFALMFELLRHTGELDRRMKSGGWSGPYADGLQLAGRRLAIIGLGGIGSTVARIATAFGMRVAAWNSGHTPVSRFVELGVEPVDDMNELIAGADVVSVHMPLIDGATRGLITADNLAHLKPGTMFVNTARAEVIEPGALTARLAKGDIPAALDVYEREPLPADDPLRAIPGIVLTPHVAWRTDGAFAELTRQMVEDVRAFLTGGEVNVVVSEHDAVRGASRD